MAEVVHRNLEAMLPQLEEFETSGIFSHDEIRTIIKFRRSHEYSMVRRPAHKEDFLAAIKYELHLDLLRKHRKKRLRITGNRGDADYGIKNRIHGLFKRMLRKFKGDLKLWLQYIEFAQNCQHKSSLSRIYGRALALHPTSINLWIMSAKFQFEDLKDPSSARTLLQQGLRANQTSQHLWLEYFRMELMHTDKVRKRKDVLCLQEGAEDKMSDDFLSYKVAMVVFQQATKAIPGEVKFRLDFLPICRLFPDTQPLQEQVYESLKRDYPLHPVTLDALARRPWIGADTSSMKASQILELDLQSEQVFEEGISRLCAAEMEEGGDTGAGPGDPTDMEEGGDTGAGPGDPASVADVWSCYLNWSLERLQDKDSFKTVERKVKKRLLTAFREPSSNGQLTTKTYDQYVRTLVSLDKQEEAAVALNSALKTHPSSVPLWLLRLEMVVGVASLVCTGKGQGEVMEEEEGVVLEVEKRRELGVVCRRALDHIPVKDSLPVWQFWLGRLMDRDDSEVEGVFRAGVDSGVSESLGVLYLEWAFKVGGLQKARKIYKKLLEPFPVPYSLYQKCLELEGLGASSPGKGVSSPGRGGMARLRDLFERAIRDYGDTRADLWLQYISAELCRVGGDVGRVSQLHWRAVKQLQPIHATRFMEQYSLLPHPNF